MDYFENRRDQEWEISVFTKAESLEAFLMHHRLDILVTGIQEDTLSLPMDRIRYCYCYTQESSEENLTENRIHKFQSAERVIEKLLGDYRRRQDKASVNSNGNMTLITIFSLRSHPRDSLLAWSMGFQLAKQKKVLLLPLELLPIPGLTFLEQSKESISDFIYYLKENPSPEQKLQELLSYNNNLAYLPEASHGFDLLSLNSEDIDKLVAALRKNTQYQIVIFYFGYYHEAGTELMKLSDRVIIVNGLEEVDTLVYKEWERQMNCIGIDTEQGKLCVKKLPVESGKTSGYSSLAELSSSSIWQQAEEYLSKGSGFQP
jgi:hypothetical protein